MTSNGSDKDRDQYKGIKPHGGRLINRFGRADTKGMFAIDTTTDLAADAENIADGIMSPLEGFMIQQDLE